VTALGDLSDELIGPAIRSGMLSGVTELVIVPHDVLAALPFAALWNRSTGRFLIENMTIGYLPSIAAMHEPPTQQRSGNTYRGVEVFAPLPDSLPGTAREAHAIGHLVPGARLRLGYASTESAVRAALDAGRPIHIASHGAHNEDDPLFSHIVVGKVARDESGADDANDGLLEMHEVTELHSTSPLVFLSGCESGLTTDASPFSQSFEEGSLAEGFLVAGAENVVATLWRVDDAKSVELAVAFYRELTSGLGPTEALARAQRAAIRRGRSGLAWAAYTVWGRTDANAE
jgi:CHAT domain-containing protein